MNLLISGELTAPPSEVGAFRDLTLYATIFRHLDCLVEVERGEADYYYNWLKNKYAFDFVREIVYIGEERGARLHYRSIRRITFNNLSDLITMVSTVR